MDQKNEKRAASVTPFGAAAAMCQADKITLKVNGKSDFSCTSEWDKFVLNIPGNTDKKRNIGLPPLHPLEQPRVFWQPGKFLAWRNASLKVRVVRSKE